ncbi:MAG: cellulose biosynthesis cyclic di-GMP-binding regulatory protein BcsB [Vampirovibrionia bacterium]
MTITIIAQRVLTNLSMLTKLVIALVLIMLYTASQPCFAQEAMNVSLGTLDDSLTDGLTLKNDKSYRDVYFTKPQTWKVLGGSNLVVTLNHSSQLIPSRSYLQIFINGNLAKRIPLDKDSIETKTFTMPIPTNLGDYNSIRFVVEQHYTDVCEDPLDHSLWTKIHPDTHIEFKYSKVQPKIDLAKYPFPLFDPYAYDTTTINYVMPKGYEDLTTNMTAISTIASDIAQKISWHKLQYIASDKLNNELNNVIIGTPEQTPELLSLNSAIGNTIKNIGGKQQFTDKNGSPLSGNEGVIYFIKNPKNSNKAILIIGSNTSEGVKQAAKYLANETLSKDLKGDYFLVKNYTPSKEQPSTIAKYIHNKSMTLKELGYEEKKAERIGPPPLRYHIKVMPDMNTSSGMLTFDLKYSYGPDCNEELSTVEVDFNGIALKSEKLDNTNGESNKTLKVSIPPELVKTNNVLDVQFNLFPVKYDYCKDYYVDKLYGIVHNDSIINLPSDAKVVLPNIGLLNDALYPYSTLQDLSNTAIIMPSQPTINDYQALLNTIGAIAKNTNSDAGINIEVAKEGDTSNSELSDRNIVSIGTIESNSLTNQIKNKLCLIYDGSYKELLPEAQQKALLAYFNNQGVFEQIISPYNPAKVISIIHGKSEEAVKYASTALSDKEKLIQINEGNFLTLDNELIENVSLPKKKSEKMAVSARETSELTSFFWPPHDLLSWAITIVIGFVAFFILVFILRIISSILFGRKGN